MELRNKESGALIDEAQFKKNHPNTSFPPVITEDIFNDFGYDIVAEGVKPAISSRYQSVIRDGVELVNGVWTKKYIIGPVYEDYTGQDGVFHSAAEQEAEYRAGIDAQQASNVRRLRDSELKGTDWTQIQDVPMDQAAWAAYRQELRDIPNQDGFPWEIMWPVDPFGNSIGDRPDLV